MTIAEELARERAEARRDATSPRPAASTTSTRSTSSTCSTGATDPWDDAEAAGVGRAAAVADPARSSGSPTRCSSLVIVVDPRRRRRRLVVHPPDQPGRRSGDPVSLHRRPTATRSRRVSERLQEQGFVEDAGVFRWYVDHHGGLELTPGYYELRTSDHMGNMLARAAHAAERRRTPRSRSRRASRSTRSPTGSTATCRR